MIAAAALVPWGSVSVACIAIYMFLANLGGGACWAVPVELNPRLIGSISGVMNGAGNFAGIFGPMSAGFFVAATGTWTLPFLVMAGLMVVSFVVYYFLVIPEPIEAKAPLPEVTVKEA